MPDAERSDRFAVVVSVAAAVGDARTLYRLRAMLGAGAEVAALDVRRAPAPAPSEDDLGPAYAAARLLRRRPRVDVCAFDVGDAWLRDAQAEDVSVWAADAVAAAFFGACAADEGLLLGASARGGAPVRLRPRDYATPALVRRAGATGRRCGAPATVLLAGLQHLGATVAAFHDWTSRDSDGGAFAVDGCDHVLHLPLVDVAALPHATCVAFRPRPDARAFVAAARSRRDATRATRARENARSLT